MSLVFNMVGGGSGGGGGGLSPNDAVIHVTALAGSKITITIFATGGTIVKVLDSPKSHVNDKENTWADWYYSVPSSQFGTCTVAAVKDGCSASKNITVNAAKQFDVVLVTTINNAIFHGDVLIDSGRYAFSTSGGSFKIFPDIDWSQPFEINLKVMLNSGVGSQLAIFGTYSGSFYHNPSIEINASRTNVWAGFSTNGSSWSKNLNIRFQTALPLNTWIGLKYSWDGSVFSLSVNDGTNTYSDSVAQTSGHYYNSNSQFVFGRNNGNINANNVWFDINSMVVKSNSSYVIP